MDHGNLTFRLRFQRLLERRIYRETGQVSDRPALVFAPHEDDETLGCGGTIALKRRRGVDVGVAFLTDGGISHRRFIPPEQMSAIRKEEALEACRILGVPEEQVCFLGFPNGALRKHLPEAARRTAEVLRASSAEEVFLPCRLDYHDEHRYTFQVVMQALQFLQVEGSLRRPVQVLEYPVWYWDHWPWVPFPAQPPEKRKEMFRRLPETAFGLRSLGMFRRSVSIAAVQEVKRRALAAHRSQMFRLVDDPNWLTMYDIAGGEFLRRFLQPYEVFRGGIRVAPSEDRKR